MDHAQYHPMSHMHHMCSLIMPNKLCTDWLLHISLYKLYSYIHHSQQVPPTHLQATHLGGLARAIDLRKSLQGVKVGVLDNQEQSRN